MSKAAASPKFTILTAARNAADGLAATAASLREQRFKDLEWVVIDGASLDDTRQRIETFDGLDIIFVSEPDTGIYSALNKGLALVRGQWLLILGAGDALCDGDVLATVAEHLDSLPGEITTAYGFVAVHDPATGKVERVWDRTWEGLDGPWGGGRPKLPCHQGVFQRSDLFVRDGFRFDERCRISADNEILLREFAAGRGRKLDVMVARFEAGGTSAQERNRLRMVWESVRINWKLGIFWRRPFYQAAVLAWNALQHAVLRVRRRSAAN